jgi:hypothetical protein
VPLEFNVGELARRLRVSLGVRGRIPLDLDERVAANINALNADAAPFRQDGARFYGGQSLGASAANLSTIAIGNQSINAGALHVIDGIWITNAEAVITGVNIGWVTFALGLVRFCRYPEKGNPLGQTTGEISYGLGPCGILSGQQAAPAVTVSDISLIIPPSTTVYVPLEVTIQNPAGAGTIAYGVESSAVNKSIYAYFTGRTYNAPASA